MSKIDFKNEEKHYINEQGKCPLCGSNNLEYFPVELDGEYLSYPYTCKECGTNGEEFYYLEFTAHRFYDKNKKQYIDLYDEL